MCKLGYFVHMSKLYSKHFVNDSRSVGTTSWETRNEKFLVKVSKASKLRLSTPGLICVFTNSLFC